MSVIIGTYRNLAGPPLVKPKVSRKLLSCSRTELSESPVLCDYFKEEQANRFGPLSMGFDWRPGAVSVYLVFLKLIEKDKGVQSLTPGSSAPDTKKVEAVMGP